MTEANESDKKNETAESTEDETIIDLKDDAAEAGTNLTTADEAPIAANEALKGDEEIIDLLQAAEVKEPEGDEAPIVLEEVVADETSDDDEIIDLADVAEEVPVPDEDEAIIDLTEIAGETLLETEDIGEPISEDFDTTMEFDDIAELDSDLIQEATDDADVQDSGIMADDLLKDDFADSLGIELDSEKDTQENLFDADKVTSEQVEAALERVVKKMFYEKIDRLLVDTIEKTVTREIEKLKKALLDDATDSEK